MSEERPIEVRLGEVVPPEDAEDWRRPRTWLAALGMIAAPLLAAAWFTFLSPSSPSEPALLTGALAAAVVSGGVLTGATQRGARWAVAATIGAALFAALVTVIIGAISAGERQLVSASPSVVHAFAAAVGGSVGALAAAPLMAVGASARRSAHMALAAAVIGSIVAVVVVRLLT
jgi:hypothetical protein